ncbi:CAP domain-containing protein [Streptomyces sp. ML-6]|uniref:CAP domain-containing protein n=1 Tax=unclassified Streptomyces TaxID=2593676 RepID=UPI0024BFA871|nr:CAP domain-containing protein [Streptomyces sp. ML-6]MDK0520611.1 CAP domain-containing protein [Streptomyces sp. ML-6]
MRKHRRKRPYRRIAVGVLAVGAVGIPSVAMACFDPQGKPAAETSWRHTAHRGAPGAHAEPASAPEPAAPSTGTPSTSTPTADAPATEAAARVLALVNDEREKAGCSPLTLDAELTKAARAHSEDMAAHRNMSHTGSDGSTPGDRITDAGYEWRAYGENVAHGYDTPESVMAGWMDSPGHRSNILDCSFEEIGVGLAGPGDYWTQDFGTAR